MRSIKAWAGLALALLLSACGGGGGASDPVVTAPGFPSPSTITGIVSPGPVAGATVQLYSVDNQGHTKLLQEVRTGNDGTYAFNAPVSAETVVLVSATGGTWADPLRKTSVALDAKLRALDVWVGPVRRVNVTPYTEIVTRAIEQAKNPLWTPAAVRTANTGAAQDLGVASLTDFARVDLTQPPGTTAPKADDVAHAIVIGAFVGFSHRLENNATQLSMAAAVDALAQLNNVDSEDDRLGPAYIGGTVDFLDATTLSADDKLKTKGLILYGKDILPTAAAVEQAMPKGVSSGTGQAPMPDDQFRLVGLPQGTTHFNQRGALVSYGDGDGKTSRHALYSASVAEVFADGDIGIGRWNGGVQMVTQPTGGTSSVTGADILSSIGWSYAAASATSQMPACGTRRLAMVGSTQLVFTPLSTGGTGPALTLTNDSALSALYLGQVQIGADIGVKTAGGEVVRLQSAGALAHPELAGFQSAAENDVALVVPVSTTFPAGATAGLTVRPAGAGARKAVAMLHIRAADGNTYSAALAFVGPDTTPDSQGCVQPGATGPGISPSPPAGSHFVFMNQADSFLYMGAPRNAVTFGAAGELVSADNILQLSGPAYDLAGNADVSIGRVTATTGRALDGNLVVRSQPYAVVRPGTTRPTTGSAQYQLVASTAVTAERGSGNAQLAPGSIDSASVTIYFDQFPIGTASPFYGTARFSVVGRFAGTPFGTEINAAQGFGPLDVRILGQTVSGASSVSGAFAGPNAEYLAVLYAGGVNGIPVKAALLFKREGP